MKLFFFIISFFSTGISYCQINAFDSTRENLPVPCVVENAMPLINDAYHNGQAGEKAKVAEVDCSRAYYCLQTRQYATTDNQVNKLKKFNASSIWLTENTEQNGVIDTNYQRIQFHIEKVMRSQTDSNTYIIVGKSKVKNNICRFTGTIKLLSFFYANCEDISNTKCGELFGRYIFYEDSSQQHSGVFQGIMDCMVLLDNDKMKIVLDESLDGADGYWNRTYVGTWKSYHSQQAKKCIWGDYRLPFTVGFDCGDGEMMICDKYVKNGWQSFNDQTEYKEISPGRWTLKNKWWLSK